MNKLLLLCSLLGYINASYAMTHESVTLQQYVDKLIADQKNLATLSPEASPLLNSNLYLLLPFDIEPLLQLGANPNIQYQTRDCPLVLAIYNAPYKVELLLQYGANPNSLGNSITPLFQAMCSTKDKMLPTIKSLLRYGADPQIKSRGLMTALMKAKAENYKSVGRLLIYFSEIKKIFASIPIQTLPKEIAAIIEGYWQANDLVLP